MVLMKAKIFFLVGPGRFSDNEEAFDQGFPEFSVGALLVYFISRSVQRIVLVISTTCRAVRFLHSLVGIFPIWPVGTCISYFLVISSRDKFFLQVNEGL